MGRTGADRRDRLHLFHRSDRFDRLVSRSLPSHLLDFALLLFFIMPIFAFGYVLFPRYKSANQPLATEEEFTVVSFGLFQGKSEQELAEHIAAWTGRKSWSPSFRTSRSSGT